MENGGFLQNHNSWNVCGGGFGMAGVQLHVFFFRLLPSNAMAFLERYIWWEITILWVI